MYGHGNGTRHSDYARELADNSTTRTRFDNGMTAHVWAQLVNTFGQSNNGNFFFHARELYSYGSHYLAGYILPREGGDSHSRGLVLINDSSYSVSTGGHVSDARGAARGSYVMIPELTELTTALRYAMQVASGAPNARPAVSELTGKPTAPARIAWGKYRKALRKPLIDHFSHVDGFPGVDTAAEVFTALGFKDANKLAKRCEAARKKAAIERRERAQKLQSRNRLESAKRFAALDPEQVKQQVVADARKVARSSGSYVDYARKESERKGREMYRAAKEAKLKGWTRIAADVKAAHAALRAALPEYEAAQARAARVKVWGYRKRDIREALNNLDTGATCTGAAGMGQAPDSYGLRKGRIAAAELAEWLMESGSWYAAPARIAGHDPEAMAAALRELESTFSEAEEKAIRRESFEKARGEVAKLRAGLRAVAGGPATGSTVDRRKAIRKAENIVYGYSPRQSYAPGNPILSPMYPLPGAWRLAGWTPERMADAQHVLAAAGRELDSMIKAEEAERAERERLARIEREADARKAWREHGEPVRDDSGRIISVTTCEEGGAMLRAEGVERDESGAIVGGTLVTSQRAEAPLTHAIRAFQFLKLCRDKAAKDSSFEGWRANGKRLRVGHFAIDSIDASGNFRAGCHKIQWAEVARLAAELGVLGIEPANTTEKRELA